MKTILLMFNRLRKTPFAWTLLCVLLLQAAFLVLGVFDALPDVCLKKGKEQVQTGVLLVLVHCLMAANTVIFMIHAFPFTSALHLLDDLENNLKASLERKFYLSTGILVVPVFVSGMLAFFVGQSLFDRHATNESWARLLEINEFLCVVLFAAFLIADILCFNASQIAVANSKKIAPALKERLLHFQRMVKLHIFGCDAPGLIGILLILGASTLLHSITAGFYWEGFVTGAVGLHIVFSQASLTLLSVVDEWK